MAEDRQAAERRRQHTAREARHDVLRQSTDLDEAATSAVLLKLAELDRHDAQQHGQTAPLAVPEVAPRRNASSGRAWQLWLAQRSHGRDRPTGRPAAASGVRASRLQNRRFPPPLTLQAQQRMEDELPRQEAALQVSSK